MIVRKDNAEPVRQLRAGPAEYLWLSTSLGVTSEAVPDVPFCASVARAAHSVDGHQDLPKGGHEVGPRGCAGTAALNVTHPQTDPATATGSFARSLRV